MLFAFLCLFGTFSPPAAAGPEPLRAVPSASVRSLTGRWYEQARFANPQEDEGTRDGFSACGPATFTYEDSDDGRLSLVVRCTRYRGSEAREDFTLGRLRMEEGSEGARWTLNRTLNPLSEWMGWGDEAHWILTTGLLDEHGDYETLVVGSPDRRRVWVLTRERQVKPELLSELVGELRERGFPTDALLFPEAK